MLIALAFALFILEAKFPTHGVLGAGGVVAMILGALFLIRSPLTGMGVSLLTAVAVVIPFGIIVIILMRLVLRSRHWKVSTGKEEMVGRSRRSAGGAGFRGCGAGSGFRARRIVARRRARPARAFRSARACA